MADLRLFALRGATRCQNTPEDIQAQVSALYAELLGANCLAEEDLVSLIFSVTPDLTALNPAAALRRSGHAQELALFSTAEPQAEGGMERVVRILLHCYGPQGMVPRHAYRNGAELLRPDRAGGRIPGP